MGFGPGQKTLTSAYDYAKPKENSQVLGTRENKTLTFRK